MKLRKLFAGTITLASTSRRGSRRRHRVHDHTRSPPKTGEAAIRIHGRSVRVGGARREEWGHGR